MKISKSIFTFDCIKYFNKSVALLLIFLLSTPPLTVFGEEVSTPLADSGSTVSTDTPSVANQESAVSADATPVVEDISSLEDDALTVQDDASKIKNAKEKPEKEKFAQPQALMSQPDPSSNTNLPPSTIKQLLPTTDQSTGSLVYNYPINVPPGRNGVQPDLALSYNSQKTEEGSVFGSGWSMNIPYIERLNKTGSNNLYTANIFTSSLDGEMVNISGSSYGPKVENGNFRKYSFSSSVWTATDKSGTVYTYGHAAGTRQDDPNDSTRISKWMLSEIRDTNNNYIKYEYYKDDGQIYPSKITYTGNGSTDGIFEVNFLRESRTDIIPFNKTGFNVETNYRIYEINIKINNALVRKYDVDYTLGDNDTRSLISSIIESGTDESNNVITLPATTFNYQTNTAGWTQDTSLTIPVIFAYGSGQDAGTRILDVNGDGLQDIVISSQASSTQTVYLNNGNGWTASSWTIPAYITDSGHRDTGFRFSDINGDNLPDILLGKDWSGSPDKHTYINNGSGWTESTSWTLPVVFTNSSYQDKGARIADVNGDGLPDIVLSDRPSTTKQVYINTGTNWVYDSSWTVPMYFNNVYAKDVGTALVDINGDGLADILWSDQSSSNNAVYINTGNGWVQDTTWGTIPEYITENGSKDPGTRFADVNSDGLMDILYARYWGSGTYEKHAYISNGKGWAEDTSITIPAVFAGASNEDWGYRSTDVKGSNLSDIMRAQHIGPGNQVKEVYFKNTARADLLSRVTYPAGGKTDITYKTSTQYLNSGTLLNPSLPFTLDTVYQVATDDNAGTVTTDTYTYENGKYYFNTPTDRRFAGFGTITKTDSAGNKVKTYYHQGDSTDSSHGEYNDDASKIGKIYRTEMMDSSGNMYQKVVNKWDKYNLGTDRDFVKLVRTTTLTYDGDSDHKDTSTEYMYDNTYGNITTKTMWGEVTASDDGSFTDTGSDKSTQTVTYTANTTDYIVGLPYQDTIVDQSSNKVSETKIYYDTQSLGTVTDGNPTKIEQWKTGSTYISTQNAYNTTYGIVTSSTDPRGKVTSYSYDSYYLYPASVTDALSHVVSYTYDYSLGKPKQMTDQNSFVYQTVYDGLDRVVAEKIPDLSSPYSTVNKTTYAYTDTSGAVSVMKTEYLDSTVSALTYQYFDGLKRLIQTREEAESDYNVRDVVYNDIGFVLKESLPYTSSGSSKTSATSTTALYTNYTYDAMYRPATAINAVGTTSYAYDDWKTTITDARSKIKNYYKDAYSNLVAVDEINSGSTYTTTYEWNLNKNLTKITDALGNLRNFTYDGLGRRLTAEDLHASGDTTYGSWSYTYDDAGNMTQSVSPESKTVNYTYDDINRVLTENETSVSGTEITYAYDSCTNGVSKLCTVTMTSGANTAYTYDGNGNIASEAKTINSSTYTTSYTYDRQGHQLVITYPDSAQVRNTYNTAGTLNQVERKESGGSYTNVVSNLDYSPMNQITTIAYANGTTTTNTYDSAHLYRLSNKTTVNGVPTNLQNITYTYDANGNITQIVDASNTDASKTVDYTYDDLNRLLTATATGVASGQSTYTHTYVYNALGNITSGPVGSYVYGGSSGSNWANPHAATSINSVTHTYDKDGNTLTDGTLTNTWNYKQQLSTSTNGTFTRTYFYDQSGSRVSSSDGTTTTVYPNKLYNYDGAKKTKSIYAGDQLVATVETVSSTVTPYYVHTDHLGSTNVISDGSGAQVQLLDYFAFGGIRIDSKTGSFGEKKQYAGSEYDGDTALNYMNARYYRSETSRFVNQDPVFQQLGQAKQTLQYLADPQQMNSYSYVANKPLMNKDPTGRYLETILDVGTLLYDGVQVVSGSIVTVGGAAIEMTGKVINSSSTERIGEKLRNGGAEYTKSEVGDLLVDGVAVALPMVSAPLLKGGIAMGKYGDNISNGASRYSKLSKDLSIQEARTNLDQGYKIIDRMKMGNPDLKNKFDKMEYKHVSEDGKDIVVHYHKNPDTGEVRDFKIKE